MRRHVSVDESGSSLWLVCAMIVAKSVSGEQTGVKKLFSAVDEIQERGGWLAMVLI